MASPGALQRVDVVLTAGCNLRCGYCYQNDKKPRSMDWETLRASADLLLRSRQPEVRMLFIGGEPLLEFPLIRRAVEYIESARKRDLTVRYNIVTNGTLLREEQAAFLVEHDFEVQLSFDGVPSAQDLRGPGTFAVLDRLLDRLREEHPVFFAERVTVAITLLPSTIPFLADSIEYFLGKEVRQLAVSPALTHQPWRDEMMAELDGQFARVFRASLRHYRRTGEVPFSLFRREGGDADERPQNVDMCGVARGETPAVDVDGQVHGCLMFVDSYQKFPTQFLRTRLEAMRMGDLRDPQLARRMAAYPSAAKAAGIFHDKQRKYSSYGRCAECRHLGTCGVCPVSIGHQPGNTDPDRIPDFQCAYNLVSLEYRERFPVQPGLRERLSQGPMSEQLRARFALAAPRATARGKARGRPAAGI
jgi:sulfatase maturation enzyme AslB (radical SAM superfamily)